MQKKFASILDDKLLSQAKTFCQRRHTTISHLLEMALSEYLKRKESSSSPFSTVEASFGILKVPPAALKATLQENIYETD